MMVRFTVPGRPAGKARPRLTKTGHAYTPKKTVDYENLVRTEYRRQCGNYMFPDGAMLDMRIIAYFGIPKSATIARKISMESGKIRPTIVPDTDNINKIIADACNRIVYKDDRQIVDCQVRKFYSHQPRVVVTIREVVHYQSEQKEN